MQMTKKGKTVIIAGSRNITDYAKVETAVRQYELENEVAEIVSGNARGVDSLGERYALENNIPLRTFPAQWEEYKEAEDKNVGQAGPDRNKDMAEVGDVLLAYWDGESSGTKNMIETAKENGLEVVVNRV